MLLNLERVVSDPVSNLWTQAGIRPNSAHGLRIATRISGNLNPRTEFPSTCLDIWGVIQTKSPLSDLLGSWGVIVDPNAIQTDREFRIQGAQYHGSMEKGSTRSR